MLHYLHHIERLFKDRDGDFWVRTSEFLVLRLRDGNVGGWFNGRGLTLTR